MTLDYFENYLAEIAMPIYALDIIYETFEKEIEKIQNKNDIKKLYGINFLIFLIKNHLKRKRNSELKKIKRLYKINHN